MKIDCVIDCDLPVLIRETAEQRAQSRLERFEEVIEDVKIAFKDHNGPRKGVDTECIVEVHLHDHPDVIIHETSDKVGKALYQGLIRAARAVARTVDVKQNRRKFQEGRQAKLEVAEV
ncbi:hypothetical protein [Rubinisphaera sp.]|uniref:hypothetical protein n=1 Tax=Rubinisphaera sp. TaxID=2024857 RepID=UPI000C0D1C2D|nr:hypothetical protein [Rubinisphaera sp.]MBV10754.1 hypothetical protein [Rubinisphaera sp.]|tara:strand:- start:1745 stop:2098 length:354 start_codon:yes stop_codon:yes gene_type:complete